MKLRSKRLMRIGKEVDRFDPIEYECDEVAADIDFLASFPQEPTARDLGLTARRWRNIIKPFRSRAF